MNPSGSSQLRINPPAAAPSAGECSDAAPVRPAAHPDDRTVISDRVPSGPEAVPIQVNYPFELGKLLAGDRLGHFELLEYVGGGGMGAVFRARDTMLDREVALKVLAPSQGADDETRRRFHVEAQSAARLDHQNIARVYYVGEDQGLNFIVFEFIRGVNIRDLVERQGPLELGDALSYTLQVAEALAHASQRNVVHRDIKPSNIIVTDDGRAKLVDMGLARLHVRTANDDLTASGVTLGTFDYISPEQARDPRTADVRSDIYSLGCTLYYMLTVRPPFPDGTVLQKLLQHQADDAPDPREFSPDLPAEAVTVLQRMLAKDPRRRFQDPGELIGELLVLADRLGLHPVTTDRFWVTPQHGQPAFWERHLPWIVPAAALLLIVTGLEWFGSSSSSLMPDHDPRLDTAAGTVDASARITRREEPTPPQAPPAIAREAAESPVRSAPDTPLNPDERTAAQPNIEVAPPLVGTSRTAPRDATVPPAGERTAPAEFRAATSPTSAGLSEPATSFDVTAAPPLAAELSVPGAADLVSSAASTPSDNVQALPPAGTNRERVAASAAKPALGAVILGNSLAERRQFASLRAACEAARNNDVIELQYSGAREEEPFELNNLKLTIRAGDGFKPIVTFRPARLGFAGFARSMITASGGRLTMINVGLVLDIPRDATAEGWSLFETRQADQLNFKACTLSILNAADNGDSFHDNVSFFDIKAAPGVDPMMKMADTPPIHPVDIVLQNCIARGEGVLIHAAEGQPLSLDWENGLLATSEVLLDSEGTTATPPTGERVEIRLTHLTALVRRGLIRTVAAADAPHILKTDVSCTNSFLITRDAPLVEQQGPQRIPLLEQQFQWNGDRNFCQGFTVFWRLVDINTPNLPRLDYEPQWRAHRRSVDTLVPQRTQIWKRAGQDERPVQALARDDFMLPERPRGTASPYEASDAGEVGAEWRKMPELSVEPARRDRRGISTTGEP